MSKKPQVVETVTQIKTLIRDNYFNLNCCKGVGSLDNSNVGLHLSVDLINKKSHKEVKNISFSDLFFLFL